MGFGFSADIRGQGGEAWLFLLAVIVAALLLFTSVFFVRHAALRLARLIARADHHVQ